MPRHDARAMVAPLRMGVVIVGYGEPQNSSSKAVRRFCKKMLLDKNRHVGNRFLWWLRVRFRMLGALSRESAQAYQAIWPQGDFPEIQALEALSAQLQQRASENEEVVVRFATLYGTDTVKKALSQLKDNNCNKVIIFPLFPQRASLVMEPLEGQIKDALAHVRLKAEIVQVEEYYRSEIYVRALAASIEHAGFDAARGDRLLLAYRSIPTSDIEKGDEYELQTGATSLSVASELDLPRTAWTMAYFAMDSDPREHLDPYVRDVVERWGSFCEGRVFVVCPGYACESIRTQYYVDRALRRNFSTYRYREEMGAGQHSNDVPSDFVYVPTLGKTRAHLKVLMSVLSPYLGKE